MPTRERRRQEQKRHFPFPEPKTVGERVKNAFAVLDYELGADWPVMIDLDSFSINDGASCVIGQLFAKDVTGVKPSSTCWHPSDAFDIGLSALRLEVKRDFNDGIAERIFDLDWLMGCDGLSVSTRTWKTALRKAQISVSGSVKAATKQREDFFAKKKARV